jgi:hypothetical protein
LPAEWRKIFYKWVAIFISIGRLGVLTFSSNWCHHCITWIFYVSQRKDCFTCLLLTIPCDIKNLHTGYKDDIFWG